MKNFTRFMVLAVAAAVVVVPAVSFGATFAYVNQNDEVSTVVAESASAALMTAPNIGMHSGVLLIDSVEDSMVLEN